MCFFRSRNFALAADSARPIASSVADITVESSPSPLPSPLDMTFPYSTECVRGFYLLKLYLFIFHNTDTLQLLPPSVLPSV